MQDLADSVSDMSKANDWFLVAPDFTDYMRAQVSPAATCWRPLQALVCTSAVSVSHRHCTAATPEA